MQWMCVTSKMRAFNGIVSSISMFNTCTYHKIYLSCCSKMYSKKSPWKLQRCHKALDSSKPKSTHTVCVTFALSQYIDVCKFFTHPALHIAIALADGSRCAIVYVPDAYWCEKTTFYKIQMKNMCFIPVKQLFVKQNLLMFSLCFFNSFVVIIALQTDRLFYICCPSQCEKGVCLHIVEIAQICDHAWFSTFFFFFFDFFLSIHRHLTIWVIKILWKTSTPH